MFEPVRFGTSHIAITYVEILLVIAEFDFRGDGFSTKKWTEHNEGNHGFVCGLFYMGNTGEYTVKNDAQVFTAQAELLHGT